MAPAHGSVSTESSISAQSGPPPNRTGSSVGSPVSTAIRAISARADWVIVEGQGSIDHPAYSAVTMGLIHGATPHAMILVHKPGQTEHDFTHIPEASFPIAELPPFIELHERIAGLVAPSKVVAVALNTSLYPSDDDAREVIDAIAAETGLPVDDPYRFGADRLWPAVRGAVEALPWV